MADESRPTVLVAHDDEVLLEHMVSVLGRVNRYRVLLAQDGQEALDVANQEIPGPYAGRCLDVKGQRL